MRCSKGHIMRSGYTRKDGTVVRPTCIIDKGNPGKGPDLIGKMKTGTLTDHGYHSTETVTKRHAALKRAMKQYGPIVVMRKLNAVCILNKNTNPKVSKIFCEDKNWTKQFY